ncbi:uncharacterized protein LOC113559036 [Rhopalosiphum maidis]|uniref:uncharacterized protein LOC113559036 n=1 Tax=Rhopalosiphum maidis TaxID=43146 RepID=UPI000EFE3797|nr:uncharacterized protein LOC113559036 [Rhopalosiphum maidis]
MNFENSDDNNVSVEFDFRGDAAPTAMEPYCDDVISDWQQSIINELRINLCREDFIYLNNHKEVEAIVSLLLNDILKKSPKNPYVHAASYLKNPQTAKLVANFKRFEDLQFEDIFKKDCQQYATAATAATIAADIEQVESTVSIYEQTEVLENDETDTMAEKSNLLAWDVLAEEETDNMTVSQKE